MNEAQVKHFILVERKKGTSIEELIKGNLEDVNQIKKLSIENENNIKKNKLSKEKRYE